MSRLVVLVLMVGWFGSAPGAAAAADAAWGWPVAGPREVSRPFAPPANRYGAGHRGADLPAPVGAAVRAAGAGRVSYAGLLAGRGVVVVVHGALRTTYEPVDAVVMVGDQVVLGDPLGALEPGHAGCPVAACLHWGLRRGVDYLDPVRLVQAAPVRLLPLAGGAGAGGLGAGGLGAGGGSAPPARPLAPALSAPVAVRPGEPRSFNAPLGALAAAALVAGIALLARPRPHLPEPPALGAAGSLSPELPEDQRTAIASTIGPDDELALRRGA